VTVADIPLRRQTTAHAGRCRRTRAAPASNSTPRGTTSTATRSAASTGGATRRPVNSPPLTTASGVQRRSCSSSTHARPPTYRRRVERPPAPRCRRTPRPSPSNRWRPAVTRSASRSSASTTPHRRHRPRVGAAWSGDAHHARISSVLDAALDGDSESVDEPDQSDAVAPTDEGEQAARPEPMTADGGTPWAGAADGEDARVRRFAGRMSPGTQVVVCSPTLDEFPAMLARRLVADDHRVTAVCPDVTTTTTRGGRSPPPTARCRWTRSVRRARRSSTGRPTSRCRAPSPGPRRQSGG